MQEILVTRGNGTAVHIATVHGEGVYGTRCNGWPVDMRNSGIRVNKVALRATCKKCLASLPAEPVEAYPTVPVAESLCVNGHDLEAVGGRDKTGKCRECKRESQRAYDRKKAAERAAANNGSDK